MKLYTQRVAPNPTKLDLYLAEKAALGREIPLERILVNLMKGEQRSPAIVAKNPLGSRHARNLEVPDAGGAGGCVKCGSTPVASQRK